MSTRASSSSPVRLATRSVHTQGGYALWAHGPPPAPQSGSPHALHTRREDTHCEHTGLLQLPSQARHTLCTHAGRIRTVGTRASSSPVRLATRSVHTQGGYALWAHGPPPSPQSGSPHALHTHREDTHCEHTGLLQLPSQARHTLCTHTQGGYALWAHEPPPAPQSGSPHALYTRREDTHSGHTGLLQLPSQARHTLCTHTGRIRTVGTSAVHTEGVHCKHRLCTDTEDVHCRHTLCTHASVQCRDSLCTHRQARCMTDHVHNR